MRGIDQPQITSPIRREGGRISFKDPGFDENIEEGVKEASVIPALKDNRLYYDK